jgi:hypothetical protein
LETAFDFAKGNLSERRGVREKQGPAKLNEPRTALK